MREIICLPVIGCRLSEVITTRRRVIYRENCFSFLNYQILLSDVVSECWGCIHYLWGYEGKISLYQSPGSPVFMLSWTNARFIRITSPSFRSLSCFAFLADPCCSRIPSSCLCKHKSSHQAQKLLKAANE